MSASCPKCKNLVYKCLFKNEEIYLCRNCNESFTTEECEPRSTSDTPKIYNPLEFGLPGLPLMIKADEYNKLKSELTAAKAEVEGLSNELNWWKCEVKTPEQIQDAINFLQSEGQKHDDEFNYEEFMRLTNLISSHCKALTSSRDAWKKMAGELAYAMKNTAALVKGELVEMSNADMTIVYEAEAAYEKLLKEDGG